MSDLTCLFSTHYSISRSILTAEEPEEIKSNAPVSIFSIAKEHKLKELFIVENSMSGFIQYYKSSEKTGIPFRFGLKLMMCNDLADKSENSFDSEHKIIVWCLNSQGYKDLLKIYSKAACDGFYYIPRSDFKTLNSQMTENLEISIPFYDSFLHNNNLKNGNCIPNFLKPPIFHLEDHSLPFDSLIKDYVVNYCKNNNCKMWNTHQIYYYKTADSLAYQTFRCINNRSNLNRPNLDHFASDQFSFESYLERLPK